jgi:hypothetical protein
VENSILAKTLAIVTIFKGGIMRRTIYRHLDKLCVASLGWRLAAYPFEIFQGDISKTLKAF